MRSARGKKAAGIMVLTVLVGGVDLLPAAATETPGVDSAEHTDFNGDGYADLAIGVPLEAVAGGKDGAVNVLYGSSPGLSATAVPDQIWHQNSSGVTGDSEWEDLFGSAIAAGDFDGDGFTDLAVGVPGEALDDCVGCDEGAVNVLYGSSGGLSESGDQFWDQDVSGVDDSADNQDYFGAALAAGDFNGDGRDDLAIGVPGEDLSSSSEGAVNVIYGSTVGLSVSFPFVVVPDQFWHQNTANVEGAAEAGDSFGEALAAGDFNGDGRDDLAIGSPEEDVASTDEGAVNLLYGSSGGLSATAVPDQLWHQNTANVEGVAETGDNFGEALAAGDFGGGTQDDLAIGVPDEGVNTSQEGAVNVLYGASSGLSATVTPDQRWHQDSTNVEDVAEEFDLFGSALTAGNFGGDTHDDLAIGVRFEDVASSDVGAVNVIYGSSGGLSATVTPDQFWHQNVANVEGSAQSGDWFGWALTAADFGGSSQDDLAIGVPGENIVSFDEGAVNVIYGASSGLSATATPDQLWHQNTANVDGAAEEDDQFGVSLTGSDSCVMSFSFC